MDTKAREIVMQEVSEELLPFPVVRTTIKDNNGDYVEPGGTAMLNEQTAMHYRNLGCISPAITGFDEKRAEAANEITKLASEAAIAKKDSTITDLQSQLDAMRQELLAAQMSSVSEDKEPSKNADNKPSDPSVTEDSTPAENEDNKPADPSVTEDPTPAENEDSKPSNPSEDNNGGKDDDTTNTEDEASGDDETNKRKVGRRSRTNR